MTSTSHQRRIPGSDFLLSGTAAVMAITCTNPVDVVKTRLQLQNEPGSANARRYRGIAHAFATIARAEGVGLRGLQRGLPPACLLQFSNVSMRFGGYAALTAALDIDPAESAAGWFGSLALGASSGFMAACVSNPFFLLKTRAQAIGGGGGGGGIGLWRLARDEGVRKGLFRGFGAFAPRVMMATAVQLPTYQLAKSTLRSRLGMGDDFATHFCASWVTGVAVVAAMQPFDFAATRTMNQGRASAAAASAAAAAGATEAASVVYASPWDCIVKTVRAEGVRGLYAGALANYLRFGPYCILVFVFLEQLRKAEAAAFARFGSKDEQ